VNSGVGQTALPDPEELVVSAADIVADALSTAAASDTAAASTTPAASKNRHAVVIKVLNKNTDDLRRIARPEWPTYADLDPLFNKVGVCVCVIVLYVYWCVESVWSLGVYCVPYI
jgi:hypothetical protein